MLRVRKSVLVVLLFSSFPAYTQQADQYRQAAQAYNDAAAKCQNPAGAMCMRQNAAYYTCIANQLGGGPTCGNIPTCSTSCTGAGAATAGGTGASGSVPFSPTMLSTNPKANAIGNLVGLGVSLLNRRSNQPVNQPEPEAPPAPDPVAVAAANEAAQQQHVKEQAADLLEESNTLLASMNGAPSGAPASPNAASVLGSLFDSGQPSSDSTSAITALLSDTGQANSGSPTPTSVIAGLLTQPPNPGDSSTAQQQAPGPPALPPPQDPQINAAFQDSVDQPDQSPPGWLAQIAQSPGQSIKDGLDSLVSSGKALASSVMNDPVVQWAASNQGSLTTVPLPAPGDDPDTAANKVFGQSVVSFGDLIQGMAKGPVGFAKALYDSGVKLVNQIATDVGLAGDSTIPPNPGSSK